MSGEWKKYFFTQVGDTREFLRFASSLTAGGYEGLMVSRTAAGRHSRNDRQTNRVPIPVRALSTYSPFFDSLCIILCITLWQMSGRRELEFHDFSLSVALYRSDFKHRDLGAERAWRFASRFTAASSPVSNLKTLSDSGGGRGCHILWPSDGFSICDNQPGARVPPTSRHNR